jgi:hypothetical protein
LFTITLQFRRTQETKKADEDVEAKDKELAALRHVCFELIGFSITVYQGLQNN